MPNDTGRSRNPEAANVSSLNAFLYHYVVGSVGAIEPQLECAGIGAAID